MTAAEVTAPSVLTERNGAILVITINRPQARNAIDMRTAHGIADAIDTLDDDPALTVGVIAGAGDCFCAGMDLKAFLRGERPRTAERGFAGLVEAPPAKPLIAAVDGPALAGGFEIVLAADLVVASTAATFGLPEVKRGLVAAGGGLTRLPEWVPRPVALEMILTGATMSAADLHRFGMINSLVEPGGALTAAVGLAERIAENGPLAVRTSKRVVVESPDWAVGDRFEHLRRITEPVFESNDAREGATAFAERRSPVWSAT